MIGGLKPTLQSNDYGIRLINGDNLSISYNKFIRNKVGLQLDSASTGNDIWLNFFLHFL